MAHSLRGQSFIGEKFIEAKSWGKWACCMCGYRERKANAGFQFPLFSLFGTGSHLMEQCQPHLGRGVLSPQLIQSENAPQDMLLGSSWGKPTLAITDIYWVSTSQYSGLDCSFALWGKCDTRRSLLVLSISSALYRVRLRVNTLNSNILWTLKERSINTVLSQKIQRAQSEHGNSESWQEETRFCCKEFTSQKLKDVEPCRAQSLCVIFMATIMKLLSSHGISSSFARTANSIPLSLALEWWRSVLTLFLPPSLKNSTSPKVGK